MMQLAKQCAFEEPSVETISGENVLTWPHVVSTHFCFLVDSTFEQCSLAEKMRTCIMDIL